MLANDTDPDSDPLEAILRSEPENGKFQLNKEGAFAYKPHPDFNGIDRFTYQASDGKDRSNTTEVRIVVEA